jgi:DNA-binding transcriptional regulator GbsR (MarR family)
MTDEEAIFVERVGQMLSAGGLPRMAGRIWGWLLICDPPEQTAASIASELHASRGSVSVTVRLLENAGLIRRSTRPRDRREYFSVPPGSVVAVLESRVPSTVAWRRLAEDGLRVLEDRPPQVRSRLQELWDVYAFMERELPALLERFESERQAQAGPIGVERKEQIA